MIERGDAQQFIGISVLKTWGDAALGRRVVRKNGSIGPARKNRSLDVAARHNLREFGGRGAGSIDRSRTGQNRILFGPSTGREVVARAIELCEANGIAVHAGRLLTSKDRDRLGLTIPESRTVLRADTARACEVVISLPQDLGAGNDAFFDESIEWARTFFARRGTLLSAVQHNDQARPHMHALFLPLQGFGRMSGAEFFGGRDRLVLMHASFHAQVGIRYGLSDRISTQERYRKSIERMAA